MIPWIFVHEPLEHWLTDYKQIFDAWEDGGVRGIAVGRLWFREPEGNGIQLWGETVTPSFATAMPVCFEAAIMAALAAM